MFYGVFLKTMAIRTILHHPDPRLRNVAAEVTHFDAALAGLIDDMFETMYDAPGIGLAATQINVHERVITVDVSRNGSEPCYFVNPKVTAKSGEEEMEEGCLSVPGIFETVRRADQIAVSYHDRDGATQTLQADGLLAVCIQHEIDHLDGKLFVDYLSQLKQQRIRKKLSKEQRLAG